MLIRLTSLPIACVLEDTSEILDDKVLKARWWILLVVLLRRLRIEFTSNFLGDSECDEPTIFEPCVQVSTPFGESILGWLSTIQLEPLPPAPLPFYCVVWTSMRMSGGPLHWQ